MGNKGWIGAGQGRSPRTNYADEMVILTLFVAAVIAIILAQFQ